MSVARATDRTLADPTDHPFHNPWWLPGGDLQTLVPFAFCRKADPPYRRESWTAPDDDFIDVDRVPGRDPAAPTLVVFHGLEGNSGARYAADLIAAATAEGWNGIAPNFRGCSGRLNRAPRFYHAGDSAEIDWVVRRARDEVAGPLYVAAISIGANMLLKWLGERGADATSLVERAVAISAPVDLAAGAPCLMGFPGGLYGWNFLRTLKPKSRSKLEQFPHLFDRDRMEAAKTLKDFDAAVTAPVHGFAGVDDYYRRSSSKPLLTRIAVPTLLLNARNDPFLPERALPTASEVSSAVSLHFPPHGGHVGFRDAGAAGCRWMSQRVMRFFEEGR